MSNATSKSALSSGRLPAAGLEAPSAHGVMVGFPPPPESRFGPDSMSKPLHMRWAFQNGSQLYHTMRVPRGEGPILPIAWGDPLDIGSLRVADAQGGQSGIDDFYARYGVDALLVLHRGKLVYERYLGDMRATTQHNAFSCTKSFVGLLVTMLAHEGQIDCSARADHYVPELAACALGDATVQQLLDMQAHAKFFGKAKVPGVVQRDYINAVFGAGGGEKTLQGIYQVLCSAEYLSPHGGLFRYDNCSTDALGWILRRVSGLNVAQLLSERIWSKLGAEQDAAMMLDCSVTEWAAAGLMMCARDMARFAEMVRQNGRCNGQQVVAPEALSEILRGGDPAVFDQGDGPTVPGGSYHNQWWFYHDRHQAYACHGQYGQRIWIAPQAETTIVQFATDSAMMNDNAALLRNIYHAIADTLSTRAT